jgi:hypothetical protein
MHFYEGEMCKKCGGFKEIANRIRDWGKKANISRK